MTKKKFIKSRPPTVLRVIQLRLLQTIPQRYQDRDINLEIMKQDTKFMQKTEQNSKYSYRLGCPEASLQVPTAQSTRKPNTMYQNPSSKPEPNQIKKPSRKAIGINTKDGQVTSIPLPPRSSGAWAPES